MNLGIVSHVPHAQAHVERLRELGVEPVVLGGDGKTPIPSSIDVLVLRTASCSHRASDQAFRWSRMGVVGRHLIVNKGVNAMEIELRRRGLLDQPVLPATSTLTAKALLDMLPTTTPSTVPLRSRFPSTHQWLVAVIENCPSLNGHGACELGDAQGVVVTTSAWSDASGLWRKKNGLPPLKDTPGAGTRRAGGRPANWYPAALVPVVPPPSVLDEESAWPSDLPPYVPDVTWVETVVERRPDLSGPRFAALCKELGVPYRTGHYARAVTRYRERHGLPPMRKLRPNARGFAANWMPAPTVVAASPAVEAPTVVAAPPAVEAAEASSPVVQPPVASREAPRRLSPVAEAAAATIVAWLNGAGVGSILIERDGTVTVARPDTVPAVRVRYES